jgi:hypothetical protein
MIDAALPARPTGSCQPCATTSGGELRLGDNEALIGWYRSTDAAVRSKGTLYLSLHQHGTYAWGRWVGMSYDGPVVSGWGAIARTEDQAHQVVLDLVNDSRP